MARRWFSRVGCTIESEKVDLTVKDLTQGKMNGHRILTDADIRPPPINEDIVLATPGNAVALTAAGVPLTWTAVIIPSQDGFTRLNSTTFQSTKKGIYIFSIQLIMANTSRTYVALTVDGVPTDGQASVLSSAISGTIISHNFTFTSARQTDGVRTYTFTGYGEDLPTPGATSQCIKCECNIVHLNPTPDQSSY